MALNYSNLVIAHKKRVKRTVNDVHNLTLNKATSYKSIR